MAILSSVSDFDNQNDKYFILNVRQQPIISYSSFSKARRLISDDTPQP